MWICVPSHALFVVCSIVGAFDHSSRIQGRRCHGQNKSIARTRARLSSELKTSCTLDQQSFLVASCRVTRALFFAVREILSRVVRPMIPPGQQEYLELRLYKSDSAGMSLYCVRESRACWDCELGLMGWELQLLMLFESLQEAINQYSARRCVLEHQGYVRSDAGTRRHLP